jgi:hypothetical protein
MEMGLQLLMRDGPVRVEFSRRLTSAEYDELLTLVQGYGVAATSADLRRDLTAAGERWGIKITAMPARSSA